MKRYIIIVISVMFLSSCKIGKDYTKLEIDMPKTFVSYTQDSTCYADMKWWDVYADTNLRNLIKYTLENNKDMKIAVAKVKEMAARRSITHADFFPQIGANIYGQDEKLNYQGDFSKPHDIEYGVKANISWELDLWGNLRWANDAAIAEYVSTIEGQRALMMSLVAEVAEIYFELIALDNELLIVKQTLNAREESVRLAKIRFEGGLTSETSYQQAKLEYAKKATLVPDLEKKIAMKENEILALSGSFPMRVKRTETQKNIMLPDSIPVGLPSDLMERRPDVRKAEQKLIAANAKVGVSYTNMFPRIALTSSLGFETDEFATLLSSPMFFISTNLLSPVFNMGKNKSKYKAQIAVYEQECYNYEKVVLSAFYDVMNALVEFDKMKEIYETRLLLEQSAKVTMDLAQLQYINGVIGYLDVLDAQRNYFDAQISLSNAYRDKQITMVKLYKALGGGWE
ncbi:MAG: efflux transporter outer membrane subunit [Bacteroidales bacterium]|nr:efflux transporter outer membrane subunit [Bacteroidales bacterium]MBR5781112.1 efflux transporter outer membrane subunit [Bacteroidales bacterium]